MKKLFLLALIVICSISLLTGCSSSLEGKWHCVKLSIDGERIINTECIDNYGHSLDLYSEIEIKNNGEGKLWIREFYEKKLDFEYEENDDEFYLYFAESEYDKKGTAKIENGQLTLTMKKNDSKIVITYEKGESENAFTQYTGIQGMVTMNHNAKLVFTTINKVYSDYIAEGKMSSLDKDSHPLCAKVSDLWVDDFLKDALMKVMEEEGAVDGYVYWEIKNYKVIWAQWSLGRYGCFTGQYPDPCNDPESIKPIGRKY